ncbi:MAG: S24 family peptidase [Pseudomonadota bacterium]
MSTYSFVDLETCTIELAVMSMGERIQALKDKRRLTHDALAKKLGVSRQAVSGWINDAKNISPNNLKALARELETSPQYLQYGELTADSEQNYLPIDVMPTYAGMGGGGSGDGEVAKAWVSRALIEDDLKANPEDLTMIDVRGDSMEPMFQHGDQIIIDRRDKNPVQPGAFCIWDGDGYVIKKVERVPGKRGFYRVFSQNSDYTEYELEEDAIKIMGRPVWFARRI